MGRIPDLEGCQSFADNLEELHVNAKEALLAYLEALIAQGEYICLPSNILTLSPPTNAFISLVEVEMFHRSALHHHKVIQL